MLPTNGDIEGGEEKPGSEGFIDWSGVDDLFIKVIGVGLNCEAKNDSDNDDYEGDLDNDSVYSGDSGGDSSKDRAKSSSNTKKSGGKNVKSRTNINNNSSSTSISIRFGPERQKRLNNHRRGFNSFPQLRSALESLERDGDMEAGSVLLRHFSERDASMGELTSEEWSRALFKVIVLQASELCRGECEQLAWQRLIRVYRSIQMRNEPVEWRLLGVILAKRLLNRDVSDELLIESIKALLSRSPEYPVVALLSSVYLRGPFVRAFHHPITFRFLSRLHHRRPSHRDDPVVLVLLGHQSLVTQNYDEAARMYSRALIVKPEWRWFLLLCVGNALLGRAFQRTCPNQPAKLFQAIIHFFAHLNVFNDSNDHPCVNGSPCVNVSPYVNGSNPLDLNNAFFIQAQFNVARALHQAGFLSQAIKFYQACLNDRLLNQMARYNLSRIYLQTGAPAMARKIMILLDK